MPSLHVVDAIARDAAYAIRGLRRNLAFSAITVAILALGIGANATVFRFVSAILLQPPPTRAPDELLQIWNYNARGGSPMERYVPLSYPGYAWYRDRATTFSGVLAFDGDPHSLSWMRDGRGEIAQGQFASDNFFALLGVNATLGTLALRGGDTSSESPTVVVSQRFWRDRLGADPQAVGAGITLNGTAFTIAGVAPPGFSGLLVGFAPDVWVPAAMFDAVRHERGVLTNRSQFWLFAVGRLKTGASPVQASAELSLLARQFAASDPALSAPHADRDRGTYAAAVFPTTLLPGPFRKYVGTFLALLQIVVLMVLLIACANATNLFLAQTVARRPELALRASLGATRARLVQLVLAQTLVLGGIAGVAGLFVSRQIAPLLLRLIPPTLPIRLDLAMDWRVVTFGGLLALLAGVLFGLAPALRATRDLALAIRTGASGGRRGSRLRNVLVVTQVAVSLVLLVAGGLCWRSLIRARSLEPGFVVHDRVAAQFDLQSLGYSDSAGRVFERRLLQRIAAIPGVKRASTTQYLPLATTQMRIDVKVPGALPAPGGESFNVQAFDVGPDFFATMGTPLLRGREFREADDERSGRVAVVNEAMARAFWPAGDAVGRTLSVPAGDHDVAYEIVGIVATGKYRSLAEPATPVVFRAERQSYNARLTVVAEIAGASPAEVLRHMEQEVARLDPNLVLITGTLADQLAFALFPARAAGYALSVTGILGLLLALTGLGAVIAQSVAQRTREIGIRMALGAQSSDVLTHIVREGAVQLAIGVAVGTVLALGATRVLSGLLYGISASDPATFVTMIALLTATALGACLLGARRATRVNPMIAMSSDR